MTNSSRTYLATVVAVVVVFGATLVAAQNPITVLENPELARVVPSGFYFQGQSAPTQMRNAAAARFESNRYVIAGLVDTSGYAADVRAKYQGFLITDSSIKLNGSDLPQGAYGFGFSNDGKLNILDLAGKEVLSVSTTKDAELKRPRPLMMLNSAGTLRLYSGKDYVTIATK
jgi:hypothetical protein